MKNRLRLFAVVLIISRFAFAGENLAMRDLQNWTIRIADEATPAEKYAAEELQQILKQAGWADLQIETGSHRYSSAILIGQAAGEHDAALKAVLSTLAEEEVFIRTQKDGIILTGGSPRGALYSVYEFLERYLGVRFLTPDHIYSPPADPQKTLPIEDFRFTPSFSFRWSYYGENRDYPAHAARLRVNTVAEDSKFGGVTSQRLINHSLHRQLPTEKYAGQHPEYYALVNGQRTLEMWGGGPQPCVTNPDVIDIVSQSVLDEIAAQPQFANYYVSQNDNNAYCRCPNCEAINQREGTPTSRIFR
jgi:hypothetical protein